MAIQIEIINSKSSKEGEYTNPPRTGISLNWAGKVLCITLDKKRIALGLEDAPKSKLNRIKSLPRISGEFDYAGKRLTFKSASVLEAFKNVRDKKAKSFLDATEKQLNEILLPQTQIELHKNNLKVKNFNASEVTTSKVAEQETQYANRSVADKAEMDTTAEAMMHASADATVETTMNSKSTTTELDSSLDVDHNTSTDNPNSANGSKKV
jgi:hypothetical protein